MITHPVRMRNSTCSLWAFINKLISKFSASLATEKSLQCLLSDMFSKFLMQIATHFPPLLCKILCDG